MKNLNPVVCTLTTLQRLQRGRRWKSSLRRYARRVERLPNGIAIELKSDLSLVELRGLVASEAECCRWMNLDLQETELPPILKITADTEEGIRTIVEMTTQD